MRHIVRDSWRAAANLDAGPIARGFFLIRDLCRCTLRDAHPAAKFGSAITIVLVAAAVVVATVSLVQSRAASQRVIALSAQVAASAVSREPNPAASVRLGQLEGEKAEVRARLGQVTAALKTAEDRLSDIGRQTSGLPVAIETARRSVALVVVGYALYESASGKPLRFASIDATGAPGANARGFLDASLDGAGPVMVSYVTGSGFLVGRRRLVTNHHVAEPWWRVESVEELIRRGFQPKYTIVRAYFPGLERAADARVVAVSADADIAVLETPVLSGRRPLTLAAAAHPINAGDAVVVVGYPTGLDALLAKLGEQGAQTMLATIDGSSDPVELADALARKHLITPLVTMGHVGDVAENNIVYDAATAHGSSGGPVLDASGEVVALNYAALEDFAGGAFGIPIRFVRQALRPQRGYAELVR